MEINMTAYIPLRARLELCLFNPYDWEKAHLLNSELRTTHSHEMSLLFLLLFTKAGCVKACRIQFLETLNELKKAYSARLLFLEGKYHEDMRLYLRYRQDYHSSKNTFFNRLEIMEKQR